MEDLNEINFQCIIEGQNYEESLKKIVSVLVLFLLWVSKDLFLTKINEWYFYQGFSKFHYTPMEVLAVIESIQKRVKHKFSPEEIESEILKDLNTEADYDIIRVVGVIPLSFFKNEMHC